MNDQSKKETASAELDDAQGGVTRRQTSEADATKNSISAKLQNAWKRMSRAAIP